MNKCYNECPGATYLAIVDQALCEPCQWGCQVCSSPYQCTQCTGGYNLYLGWCYLQCPANTVPSINNNIYTCSSCLTSSADPNCLACDTNRCI